LLKRDDWQHEDDGFYPRATLGELLMRAREIIEADVGRQPPVGKRKGGKANRAVRLAELDGLFTVQRRPRSGRKHLANIIRVIRAEWLDWLSKGRRKTYATNACNRAKPISAEARGVLNHPPRSKVLGRGFAKKERSGCGDGEPPDAAGHSGGSA
jgi:hypothetical protein